MKNLSTYNVHIQIPIEAESEEQAISMGRSRMLGMPVGSVK